MPIQATVWGWFIATGCIVYRAIFLSKVTGEHFIDKSKLKNEFDTRFLLTVGQALLGYAITIPFFIVEHTSLLPTVGIFHALARTFLVLLLWYVLPEHRFVAIPFAVVLIDVVTMWILGNGRPRE